MASNEILHQGWLTQTKPIKKVLALSLQRSKKKWFILKPGKRSDQFFLEYFDDQNCTMSRGKISLEGCKGVGEKVQPRSSKPQTFAMVINTAKGRCLFEGESEQEIREWVDCLVRFCGLKQIPHEHEEIVSGPLTCIQSSQNDSRYGNVNLECSDGGNPVIETSTGCQYIKISECYSGRKPPVDTTPSNYANENSFVFPPTHYSNHCFHTSTEIIEDGLNKLSTSNTPPPRPPKRLPQGSMISNLPERKILGTKKEAPSNTTINLKVDQDDFNDSSPNSPSLSSSAPSSSIYSNIHDICISPSTLNISEVNAASFMPQNISDPVSLPPKVDRSLKPKVKQEFTDSENSLINPLSPSLSYANKSMTLPSKAKCFEANHAPRIDRDLKPPERFDLGFTPSHVKYDNNENKSFPKTVKTNTLPESSKRRNGPKLSTGDASSNICRDFERGSSLNYLVVGCSQPSNVKTLPNHHAPQSRKTVLDVEYRKIDHVKTKALSQTKEDRARQLQNRSKKS